MLTFGQQNTWSVGTENNVGEWNPVTQSWKDLGNLGGWPLLDLTFDGQDTMWGVKTNYQVGVWDSATKSWKDLGWLGEWWAMTLTFGPINPDL
jgi:hypothetical protein